MGYNGEYTGYTQKIIGRSLEYNWNLTDIMGNITDTVER